MEACVSTRDGWRILLSAFTGDLDELQRVRYETGDDDAFRKKCEHSKGPEGFTCLHLAADNGDIPIFRVLIEKLNLDVDMETERGDTALLVAAAKGHFKAVKYLILRGADINFSGYKGITCFHLAAERGNKEIMQMLLLRGADLEARSVKGTPLTCAASSGCVESVRFLLRRGANPNADSPLSGTPLMGALLCPSYECFDLLLKAGANPNTFSLGLSPLAVAVRDKDTKLLRSLLANGADPNLSTIDLLKPIEHAVDVGNLDGVNILFPLTERMMEYRDWSIQGIINRFHSEQAKRQRMAALVVTFWELDKLGKGALGSGDYQEALKWFNMALILQPDDETLLENRSKCWIALHEPNFLLHDAEAYILLKPNSPKAHCMKGIAWMLLKNFPVACKSYKSAIDLDPYSIEIKNLFSIAAKGFLLSLAEKNLMRTVTSLPKVIPHCEIFCSTLLELANENPTEAMNLLRQFLDRPEFLF
ncbi:ankyrin repeat family protein [Striga hermonthica]|uniref:Ankyrin repeat family protein n=1 Tax=Striga hermonthica TaxID=68872 RepID=A0A9N7NE95_STRHE|nr:ankyrin repeat family protein [Striga hermonthica]